MTSYGFVTFWMQPVKRCSLRPGEFTCGSGFRPEVEPLARAAPGNRRRSRQGRFVRLPKRPPGDPLEKDDRHERSSYPWLLRCEPGCGLEHDFTGSSSPDRRIGRTPRHRGFLISLDRDPGRCQTTGARCTRCSCDSARSKPPFTSTPSRSSGPFPAGSPPGAHFRPAPRGLPRGHLSHRPLVVGCSEDLREGLPCFRGATTRSGSGRTLQAGFPSRKGRSRPDRVSRRGDYRSSDRAAGPPGCGLS